ncbi:MAG: hypothetical protein JSV26_02675 [bacterium]|nr:MAG: hypothetical protein JSV26_02675 [bacterium]
MSDDRIKFEECPVCSGCHEFVLDVHRKSIQVVISPDRETDTAFTKADVLFTCPDKDQTFEAEVTLLHRPYEYIKSVEVKSEDD